MALSDLAVFSEFVYRAMTEVVAQQIEVFNGASENVLMLQPGNHIGDYSDKTMFAKVSGLVRRRDPYGTSTPTAKSLAMLVDTMVKVAAGTPPVDLSPGQFRWIQMNPEEAGAMLGQQLAGDLLADMLNTTVGALVAAISGQSSLIHDITANTPAAGDPSTSTSLNPVQLTIAAGLFGDRMNELGAWVMNSFSMTQLYQNALTNAERLFQYGSVNVMRDPFGRLFVISDIPALTVAGTPNKYNTLGLVPGAARCDQNNDFDYTLQEIAGGENIKRLYQAEWSYELGIKGYSWNKSGGGHAPADSALFTSSNWTKIATSTKDTAGVMLIAK